MQRLRFHSYWKSYWWTDLGYAQTATIKIGLLAVADTIFIFSQTTATGGKEQM